MSFRLITLLTIILAFSSCASTSDVISNSRIQKRKYTKGFYVEKRNTHNKGVANSKVEHSDRSDIPQTEVAIIEDSTKSDVESIDDVFIQIDSVNTDETPVERNITRKRLSDLTLMPVISGRAFESKQVYSEKKKSKRKEKFTKLTNAARFFVFLSSWFIVWPIHIPIVCAILSATGIAFGIVSLTKLRKHQKKNKFFCYFAIVYGLVLLVVAIIVMV